MSDIEQEFVEHARFERADDAFEPVTNDWDAILEVTDGTVEITVTLPTLSAVVAEDVAAVVEDGWFETFELRVEDADKVTLADEVTEPAVERRGDEIVVELAVDPREGKAADDALAIVNYVEGTWFEGVIPGYDYVEQVQSMREQAATQAEGQGEGTPL